MPQAYLTVFTLVNIWRFTQLVARMLAVKGDVAFLVISMGLG